MGSDFVEQEVKNIFVVIILHNNRLQCSILKYGEYKFEVTSFLKCNLLLFSRAYFVIIFIFALYMLNITKACMYAASSERTDYGLYTNTVK